MSDTIPGTIFDADLPDLTTDYVRWQRACGLFYLHDVNPGSVSLGGVEVTRHINFSNDRVYEVEVSYLAIVPREGETQWGEKGLPVGMTCEHGDTPHKVVERRSFVAKLQEVAR